MKQNSLIIGAVLTIVILSSSMFTVHMTQNVVVLELQKPKEIITKPGLYFKIPFLQQVRYFSNQLLDNDSNPAEVITKDKKNMLIDNFTMFRIVDPLKFLETVRGEQGARARLDDIIYSELRVEIGTHGLLDIVTETRDTIMAKVTKETNIKAAEYGIEVVEVRIKRTDLPPEIANSIFNRMWTLLSVSPWNTGLKEKKKPPKFVPKQIKKKPFWSQKPTSRSSQFEVKETQ